MCWRRDFSCSMITLTFSAFQTHTQSHQSFLKPQNFPFTKCFHLPVNLNSQSPSNQRSMTAGWDKNIKARDRCNPPPPIIWNHNTSKIDSLLVVCGYKSHPEPAGTRSLRGQMFLSLHHIISFKQHLISGLCLTSLWTFQSFLSTQAELNLKGAQFVRTHFCNEKYELKVK